MKVHTSLTWAKVFGILIIIVYLAMSFVYNAKIGTPKVKNPIIELEFANSDAQIHQIFAGENGALNNNLVAALLLSTKVDFLFAVVYALFLVFFFAAVSAARGKKFYIIGLVLSLVAMLFDILENTQLLQIMSTPQAESFGKHVELLHTFTWVKWTSLAVALLFAAWFAIGTRKVLPVIIGVIALLPILLILPAVFNHSLTTIFALTVILGIVALIILVFAGLKKILT